MYKTIMIVCFLSFLWGVGRVKQKVSTECNYYRGEVRFLPDNAFCTTCS